MRVDRRSEAAVWRDVIWGDSAGEVLLVVIMGVDSEGVVEVKERNAVRTPVWESEARIFGSMEEGVGMAGDKGEKGVEVGGRRRDSQVWRSVWRL